MKLNCSCHLVNSFERKQVNECNKHKLVGYTHSMYTTKNCPGVIWFTTHDVKRTPNSTISIEVIDNSCTSIRGIAAANGERMNNNDFLIILYFSQVSQIKTLWRSCTLATGIRNPLTARKKSTTLCCTVGNVDRKSGRHLSIWRIEYRIWTKLISNISRCDYYRLQTIAYASVNTFRIETVFETALGSSQRE
jgi:hypothetical protein